MKVNRLAMAVSGIVIGGFTGMAHGQLINPGSTTYEYSQTATNWGEYDIAATDVGLTGGNFGSGQLNDGVTGNNTWLASTGLNDQAYNHVGAGVLGNVLFMTGETVTFNLGAVYNLSSVTLGLTDDNSVGVSAPGTVSVTDGTNTATGTAYAGQTSGALSPWTYYNADPSSPPAPSTVYYNQGYQSDTINLSGLSGQFITLTFTNSDWGPGGWIGLNEVEFDGTAVPEPASLSLLGLGALALLARRRSQKA